MSRLMAGLVFVIGYPVIGSHLPVSYFYTQQYTVSFLLPLLETPVMLDSYLFNKCNT